MKKVLLRVFALCSAAWLCVGGAKADVAPVEPSTVGGVYQIGSAAHLVWFSDFINASKDNVTAQAVLTADIDMSEVESFTPIGKTAHSGTYNSNDFAFKGVFDGQGHTISNLSVSVDATQPWQAGLFGRITNATVRNLALQTVSITQTSGTAAAAGALAGRNGSSTVTNCCAVDVSFTQKKKSSSGKSATSGLVGYMSDAVASQMINCYTNYPTLTILGAKATITNSYCDVDVATKAATGELCYLLNEKSSTNPAWFQTLGTDAYPVLDKTHSVVYGNGDFYCDGLTPKGEVTYSNVNAATRDAHTFVDGICSVCHQCDPGYVAADGEGFFEIANVSQLKWFAVYVQTVSDTAKGKLTADIDMAGEGWTGIDGFRGTFDGGSHTISNLGAPFFYATEGNTVVRNLTLSADAVLVNPGAESGFAAFICQSNKTTAGSLLIENCVNNTAVSNPSTKSWIGGFVGCAANGSTETTTTVRNCVNNGAISATGGEAVAGFIGSCRKGDFYFLNSTNNGAITAPKAVGGFVGQGQTPASMTFTDCSNTADFTVTENSLSRTGGIIGSIYTCPITTVTRCWNTGNISGEFASVGGIVGYMDAKSASLAITDCYNTGNITAGSGAAGILSVDAFGTAAMTVTNCWSSGTVTGGNASTPFACSGAVFTNCFNVEGTQENVTTVTAEQLASGEVAYKLNGDQTAIVWFETIGTDAAPSFSGETVYKTSDAGWGTFFDTEKAYAFTGVKAYTGKIDGSVLKLTEVSQANAGTPVILEGTYYNKVAKATPAEMPENDLKGTATDLAADGSQYVLAKKDDVVGFYQATEGTIAAGKAYLTGISAGVKAVTFGTIDGIVSPLGETEEGAAIYDLSGRRVEKATKGLYIINGKKVLF